MHYYVVPLLHQGLKAHNLTLGIKAAFAKSNLNLETETVYHSYIQANDINVIYNIIKGTEYRELGLTPYGHAYQAFTIIPPFGWRTWPLI